VQSVDRDGFVFDMGLRAVENAGIVLPMLEELGLRLDFVRSPVSIGIEDDLIRVDSEASLADYRDLLVRTYPDSAADVDRIMRLIRRIMKDMDVLYGIDNPLFKDVMRDRATSSGRCCRGCSASCSPSGASTACRARSRTLLDELTDDDGLKSIIGQHFFKGTPAFFAMSYFSVYLDYLYPRGGTAALMGLLEGYVRERGVDVRTELPIVAVDPEARTVTDRDGGVHGYRSLIWCADLKTLYRAVDAAAIADPRLAAGGGRAARGAGGVRRQRLRAVALPLGRRGAGRLRGGLRGAPLLLARRPRPGRPAHAGVGGAAGAARRRGRCPRSR
jgi:phytoene dehydrogenase-like protein